ncbi:MAG: Hsp20/alpha crystallin family protein [Phycisphaerae bacterium]
MNLIPWRNKRSGNGRRETSSELDLGRFRSEVHEMLDRFFRDPFGLHHQPDALLEGWAVPLDVVETDKDITLKVEVPGVDPKDIEINVSGNGLTVSGEKMDSTVQSHDGWCHSERRFGRFRRSIQLPNSVDTDKVSAEHAHGVLTVRIEKQRAAAPKRVAVKAPAR